MIGASAWVGPQTGDPKPILYLSGQGGYTSDFEENLFRLGGCRYRCISYILAGTNSPRRSGYGMRALVQAKDAGMRVFMDSGAHTFQHMQLFGTNLKHIPKSQREAHIEKLVMAFAGLYADFIKTQDWLDFYVNLDYKMVCPVVYQMQKHLESLGIHPVPVYHGDDSTDWVKRYIDEGYKLIGLGMDKVGKRGKVGVRRYLDACFTLTEKHGIAVHGFAFTGDAMLEFPWFSVDSSSWLQSAINGCMLVVRTRGKHANMVATYIGLRKQLSHLIDTTYLSEVAKAHGFDFETMRTNWKYLALYNARVTTDFVQRKHIGPTWIQWAKLVS